MTPFPLPGQAPSGRNAACAVFHCFGRTSPSFRSGSRGAIRCGGCPAISFTAQLLEGAGQERLDLRSGERGFMVGRPRSGMFKQFLFGQEPAGRVDRIEDHVVPFVQRAFLAFALFGPSRLSGGLGGSFGLPGPAWAALHHTGNGRFRAGGPDRSGCLVLLQVGNSGPH